MRVQAAADSSSSSSTGADKSSMWRTDGAVGANCADVWMSLEHICPKSDVIILRRDSELKDVSELVPVLVNVGHARSRLDCVG